MVVESNVREVSPVIVPVTAKLPLDVIAPQPTVPKPETFPSETNGLVHEHNQEKNKHLAHF